MEELRTAVIEDLLDRPTCLLPDQCRVIGQAVAMRHNAIEHLSETDRQEYLTHV